MSSLDLLSVIPAHIQSLLTLYSTIGVNQDQQQDELTQLVKQATQLYQNKIDYYESEKSQLLSTISGLQQELSTLCALLVEPTPQATSTTLQQQVEEYKKLMSDFKQIEADRSIQSSSLFATLTSLSSTLALAAPVAPTNLSSESIEQLKQNLQDYENIKTQRKQRIDELFNDLHSLWRELDHSFGQIEHAKIDTMLCSDSVSSNVELTQEFINVLEERLSKLKQTKQNNQNQLNELVEQLRFIWQRFQFDVDSSDSQRVEFLSAGCTYKQIEEMKNLIEKYQMLKLSKIKDIIFSKRIAINDLYTALYYSQQQMNDFTAMLSVDYTEAVLERHERELARLIAYQTSIAKVMELYQERDKMKAEIDRIDLRAQDSSRLKSRDAFKILKEEEHNKNVKDKKLPALEDKLLNMVQAWEADSAHAGERIMMHGKSLAEELIAAKKEHEAKTTKKSSGKIPETPASTPLKSARPATATPLKSAATPSAASTPRTVSKCDSESTLHDADLSATPARKPAASKVAATPVSQSIAAALQHGATSLSLTSQRAGHVAPPSTPQVTAPTASPAASKIPTAGTLMGTTPLNKPTQQKKKEAKALPAVPGFEENVSKNILSELKSSNNASNVLITPSVTDKTAPSSLYNLQQVLANASAAENTDQSIAILTAAIETTSNPRPTHNQLRLLLDARSVVYEGLGMWGLAWEDSKRAQDLLEGKSAHAQHDAENQTVQA